MVHSLPTRLLWRHVSHCPHDGGGLCQIGSPFEFCYSKVHDFRLAFLGEHDVGWFDVPMDDASFVSFFKTIGHLSNNIDGLFDLKRTFGNLVFQAFPFDVGHGDEGLPFGFVDFMDSTDMRMVQSCCRLGFLDETLFGLFVPSELFR